jgi:hypothetical protein
MLYTCLILAGIGGIYLFKGWVSLLWLSMLGGWTIFLMGLLSTLDPDTQLLLSNQWSVQGAVLFGLLIFWILPVYREVASRAEGTRWTKASMGIGDNVISGDIKVILQHHILLLVIAIPILSLAMARAIWPELSDAEFGWITMGGAAIYGYIFQILRQKAGFSILAYSHAIMALLSTTVALSLLLEGDTLLFAIAAEATALHLVACKTGQKPFSVFAHFIFVIIALMLIDRLHLTEITRLGDEPEGMAILNAQALTDLWVIGLGLLMSIRLKSLLEKRVYLIAAFAVFAAWLSRELQGNVLFVAVTAEAVLLHGIAFWKKDNIVTMAGHIFFASLGLWLGQRLFNPLQDHTAIFNLNAGANLLIIIVAVQMSRILRTVQETNWYLILAHIALLGWFLSEFVQLDNGQGYVTIAWGVYAAILLILGLVKDNHGMRKVSMITLFVVVGKLFLVDLANLEVLWRILLFMGFGGLFLFLSYYFQDLWKGKEDSNLKAGE